MLTANMSAQWNQQANARPIEYDVPGTLWSGNLGKRFWSGVALYRGRETIPFGDRLHAVPIEALWRA